MKWESKKAGLKRNIQKTKIMASDPITVNKRGESRSSDRFYFLGLQNHCRHEIKRYLLLRRKPDKPRQCIKKQRYHLIHKGQYSQEYDFSNVRMWELDHKEGWAPKNSCFQTVVLEKTPESPLNCKEIKQINHKGNQPWISIGRTDAEAPIFWPPYAKSQLIGKDPDAGKDWGQEEKRVIENEMVR